MSLKRMKRAPSIDPAAGQWLKGEKLGEGVYAYDIPRDPNADFFALNPLYIPDDWYGGKSEAPAEAAPQPPKED